MDVVLLSNPLRTWLLALGVAAGTALFLYLAKIVIARRAAILAARTVTRVDDFLAKMVASTYPLVMVVLALYVGSTFLALPAKYALLTWRLAAMTLLVQAAVWGDAGVRFWRGNEQRALGQQPGLGSVTSVSIVCFVLRAAVWVVVTLMILDNFGFNITTLVASLGISGIAVALAVQNILGDLFASLSIVLDKPFVVGDFIIVGDVLGAVESVGLKTTRLRGLGGEQIVFSNAELLKSRIHNHQRMLRRRVAFVIRVSYQSSDAQLRAVPAIVRELVRAQPNADFERAHLFACAESSLDFEVVYHVTSPDYVVHMDTQQEILLGLYRRFASEQIAFAHPLQLVRLSADRHLDALLDRMQEPPAGVTRYAS